MKTDQKLRKHWRRRIEEEFAGWLEKAFPDGVEEYQRNEMKGAFLAGLLTREILERDFDKLADSSVKRIAVMEAVRASDLLDEVTRKAMAEFISADFVRKGIVNPEGGESQ